MVSACPYHWNWLGYVLGIENNCRCEYCFLFNAKTMLGRTLNLYAIFELVIPTAIIVMTDSDSLNTQHCQITTEWTLCPLLPSSLSPWQPQ